jgi:hypothetical protein
MDAADYWILDSAHEAWYPLDLLVSPDIEAAYNRATHGLSYEALLAVLERLFQRGDLAAELVERPEVRRPTQPTRAEIEAALARTIFMIYGLSLQGGARWEAVSQPDWRRYIYGAYTIDPHEGEIIAQDRAVVETYLACLPYVTDTIVEPTSLTWDVLEPWHATYWKTLPIGHRVRFRYTSLDSNEPRIVPPDMAQWLERMQQWYTPYDPQRS